MLHPDDGDAKGAHHRSFAQPAQLGLQVGGEPDAAHAEPGGLADGAAHQVSQPDQQAAPRLDLVQHLLESAERRCAQGVWISCEMGQFAALGRAHGRLHR